MRPQISHSPTSLIMVTAASAVMPLRLQNANAQTGEDHKQVHVFASDFTAQSITGFNATTDEIRLIGIQRHTATVSISGDDVVITLNNNTPSNTGSMIKPSR